MSENKEEVATTVNSPEIAEAKGLHLMKQNCILYTHFHKKIVFTYTDDDTKTFDDMSLALHGKIGYKYQGPQPPLSNSSYEVILKAEKPETADSKDANSAIAATYTGFPLYVHTLKPSLWPDYNPIKKRKSDDCDDKMIQLFAVKNTHGFVYSGPKVGSTSSISVPIPIIIIALLYVTSRRWSGDMEIIS